MKILLFGASGAGSTTQGHDLSAILHIPYFDSDDYFWEISDPPFTVRRDPLKRNELLKNDLSKQPDWILGGSMVNWGEEWLSIFDLAVFLYIPPAVRLERIGKRELERYGTVILTDPERIRLYNKFISWCEGYDENTAKGRTLAAHQDWTRKIHCPVLTVNGDFTVQERRKIILDQIAAI